uniref:3-oxoacyl-[acyl-carrier-protein] synthase I, chloroplastic n=1 Tax=Eutreptiella gymnastica TaxID=73025 RepID=A0A7S4CSG9_9EUGL
MAAGVFALGAPRAELYAQPAPATAAGTLTAQPALALRSAPAAAAARRAYSAEAPATAGRPMAAAPAAAATRTIEAGGWWSLGAMLLPFLGLAAWIARTTRSAPAPAAPRPMAMAAVVADRSTLDPKKRVVVTGMGVASVFGNDVDAFYDALLEGKSGVKPITRFDVEKMPTKFAAQIENFDSDGIIPKKFARRYDDVLSYTAVASTKALQQAGLDKATNPEANEKLNKAKCGVLVGSGMGGLQTLQDGVSSNEAKGSMSPFVIPYSIANMGGSLVAIEQGFMGPNYSIATACATANYCFCESADHIRSGKAEVMVAGGSEASIVPVGLGGFVACRALSKNNEDPQGASRPWDKDRDGFVMGEGAGVLVLESLEHAQKRGATILAEYLGGAMTCDAHHVTMPREDGEGVGSCIKMALEDAQIDRDQVNYINAHATSTPLGDVAEVNAIKKVFEGNMKGIKMNGTKSMIGHCLGAAGGMEAIATIKAIQTGYVHPTLNQDNLIEEVADIDTCAGAKSELEITAGISNSFGFGGHNSVCVFGPYKP